MTARERKAYYVILSLAVFATVIPLLLQISRLAGGRAFEFVASVTFLPSLPLMPIAPILIVAGIGYAVWIRSRMAARQHVPAERPSILAFITCALVWLLVLYSFRVLPLFLGEGNIRPSVWDPWLNKLL